MRLKSILLFVFVSITVFADSPEQRQFDFASGLMSRNLYPAARTEFEKFLKDYPSGEFAAPALYRLADCYFLEKKWDSASDEFIEFLKKHPNHELIPYVWYRLGEIRYRQKEYDKAVVNLQKALENSPPDEIKIGIEYYSGLSYLENNNAEKAIAPLKRAAAVKPYGELTPYAIFSLGRAYQITGDYASADKNYRLILDGKVENIVIAESLMQAAGLGSGELLLETKKYKEAAESYNKIWGKYPKSTAGNEALLGMSVAYGKLKDYKKILSLESEVRTLSKSADTYVKVLLQIADAAYQLEDYKKAKELNEEIIGLLGEGEKSQKAMALLGTAWCEFMLKDLTSVKKICEELRRNYKNGIPGGEVSFLLAQVYFEKKDYNGASMEYLNLISNYKSSPFMAESIYGLGWCYYRSKRYEDCGKTMMGFAEKYPKSDKSVGALLLAGDAYTQSEKFEDASRAYQTLLEKFPDAPPVKREEALYQLAQNYYRLGKFDKTSETLSNLISQYPNSSYTPDALYWRGYNEETNKNYEGAISGYMKVVEKYPSSKLAPEARQRLAGIWFAQKKYENAANQFTELILGKSGNITIAENVYLWVGQYWGDNKKFEKALEIYSAYKEKFPHAKTYGILQEAKVYRKKGDAGKAKSLYESIISKEDGKPYLDQILFGIGDCLVSVKKYSEAESYLQKVTAGSGDIWTALATERLGDAYREQGKNEDARREYLRLAILYDDPELTPRALYNAGSLAEDLGLLDEAKSEYGEIITRYPDSPEAKKAEERLKEIGS